MDSEYNPQTIEPRRQRAWEDAQLYYTGDTPDKPKYYSLVMFPYPSGDLHMGHMRNYTIGDVIARYHTMRGYTVMNPMGWDAFGLPAENAAIKEGLHPQDRTLANIERMKAQFFKMGIRYDWPREVASCLPDYYRWTQWLFLLLYKRGLAYRKKAAANWCPQDQTVLANEQVVDGRCERCGTLVTKRDLEQWFFRITEYAERLLTDLDGLTEWPERVRTMQRNWIGRSVGAELDWAVADRPERVRFFTTRPDTVYGATFMVLAPEHPLVAALTVPAQAAAVAAYVAQTRRLGDIERLSTEHEKTGVALGTAVINPYTGARIPIWIADYVLATYGTGAIMAVPGGDERDAAFAAAYGLPVLPPDPPPGADLPAKEAVVYRLRDWLVSRQRYWGPPIPIVYCDRCGEVPVPEDQLPVLLPYAVDFQPGGDSPLARDPAFVHTTCPTCGGPAQRETDTLDTFVDSSWYFLRFCDPHNAVVPFDPALAARWLPVDQYTGGIEHAILHLLYARFITKVLADAGWSPVGEPFRRLFTQGMITKDGLKMSKSRGNVVPVDGFVATHGADTGRVFILFIGPPDAGAEWSNAGAEGAARFLARVWRLYGGVDLDGGSGVGGRGSDGGPGVRGQGSDGDVGHAASAPSCNRQSAIGNRQSADPAPSPSPEGRGELDGAGEGSGVRGQGSDDDAREETTDPASPNTQYAIRNTPPADRALLRQAHATIRRVTDDIARFHFNTAVSAAMELTNALTAYREAQGVTAAYTETARLLLLLLAPIAPHITDELWQQHGGAGSIHAQPWPVADPALAAADTVELIVQVNGKLRDRLTLPAPLDAATAQAAALASPKVAPTLAGRAPRQIIYVPGRVVNVVV
ncbi:MAG: leucine--tRNA ligase [Chloroflexota bacterium]|nr:leucine--tRNA ligase [Chloroflexota bacterium]